MSEEVKDCRNCRHGHYNDHWGLPFCYNSKDCKEWELWEPKEGEEKDAQSRG